MVSSERKLNTTKIENLLTHDTDTEVMIVASLLRFQSARDKINRIIPEDFYNKKNKNFFISLKGYVEDNEDFDVLDYKRVCKISLSEYSPPDLLEVEFTQHIKRLKEISNLRKLEKTAYEITQDCQVGKDSIEIRNKYLEVLDTISSYSLKDIKTVIEIDVEFEEDILSYDFSKNISTGFVALDKVIGGLYPSRLYAIGGTPAVGKTTFMLNIMHNTLKNGKKVLFVCLEMSYKEIINKLISQIASTSTTTLRGFKQKEFANDTLEKSIESAREEVRNYKLNFVGKGGITVPEIMDKAKYLGEVDIIYIDYLQLLKHGQGATRYEQISKTSRDLKLMASKLEIPVVVIASINRSNLQRLDRKPQISDFRDSGNIEYDLDCALLLYRASQFKSGADESRAELNLAKYRYGRSNVEFDMDWCPDKSMFVNMWERENNET